MAELTGVERIANILSRRPVDRIGLYEHFWGDTLKKWRGEGHISEDEDLATHFGFDMAGCWPFKMVARLDFEPEDGPATVNPSCMEVSQRNLTLQNRTVRGRLRPEACLLLKQLKNGRSTIFKAIPMFFRSGRL